MTFARPVPMIARIAVVACGLSALPGCSPPPEFVLGVTTDRQGRPALVVQACGDGSSAGTARIWLRDGSGPPYPHASTPPAAPDEEPSASPPVDVGVVAVFEGPTRAGEPTVVAFVEPSAAGWKAEPAVTSLVPRRRYTVSRPGMTELAFDPGWSGEEPLGRPGTITTGFVNADGKPSETMDSSRWPQYVKRLCRT